jgi:hypothetical protein
MCYFRRRVIAGVAVVVAPGLGNTFRGVMFATVTSAGAPSATGPSDVSGDSSGGVFERK